MASFLSNLFGSGATGEAADQNRALGMDYYQRGLGFQDAAYNNSVGALGTGHAGATQALGQASAAYDPLAALGTKYGAATTLGLDSLGVNGADGNTRAVNAFQTGPGYQFAQDQGLQALDRRRAVTGMYGSGNADIDTLKFSQGLGNQEYGNWQNKLLGFTSPELSATAGAAGGRAGAATGLAGLETGYGNNLTSLYGSDASNRTNLLGSLTSNNMQANNASAAAETAGSRNLLNAGMGLATLAMGMPPGMGGGNGFNFGGGSGGYNAGSTGGGNPFPLPRTF